MAKINDMAAKSRYKVFIYGEMGTGKTYSLATFPSPLYILDCDEGVATLQGLVGDDFEYDNFTDSNPGNPTGYANLRKKVGELRRKCPYETVVLDSATTLGEKLIPNAIRALSKDPEAPPTLQDHLKIGDKLEQVLAEILGIDANIVVISHPKVIQDENTSEIKYLSMLTGQKLPQKMPLYFDEMYKADKRFDGKTQDFEYVWQIRGDRRWPTRSRFNYQDSEGVSRPILDKEEPQDFGAILAKVKLAREGGLR